jgi:O-antigen/teichoic acid export membrane protein
LSGGENPEIEKSTGCQIKIMSKIFKELTSHSVLYMIGSVANLASSILLLPVYTRFLNKVDYGLLEMTDTINAFMLIILMSGFGPAVAKLFNDARDEKERKDVIGTIFTSSFVCGILWGIILYMFRSQLSVLLLGDDKFIPQMTIAIGVLIVSPAVTIGNYQFNLYKRPKSFVVVGLIRLVVNVSLNLFFIVHLRMGALGMLFGEFSTSILQALFFAVYIKIFNGLPFNILILKRALKFGLPFIPAMLGATIMHRADRYLVQNYCSLADMGLYGIGFRFPYMLSTIMISSFGQVWNSTGLYDVAKMKDGRIVQARLATYYFMLITLADLGLAFMGSTIIRVLTTSEYYPAFQVLQIISISMIIYSLHQFFYTGALVKNKPWLLPASYTIAAIVNVTLNILLLPKFGYMAAAWVSVATYSVFGAVLYFLCNPLYPIPYEFKRMGGLLSLGILLLIVNNKFMVSNWILDAGKQALLYLILPVFALFGPFLRNDEIIEFSQLLDKINPSVGAVYRKIIRLVRKIPAEAVNPTN